MFIVFKDQWWLWETAQPINIQEASKMRSHPVQAMENSTEEEHPFIHKYAFYSVLGNHWKAPTC